MNGLAQALRSAADGFGYTVAPETYGAARQRATQRRVSNGLSNGLNMNQAANIAFQESDMGLGMGLQGQYRANKSNGLAMAAQKQGLAQQKTTFGQQQTLFQQGQKDRARQAQQQAQDKQRQEAARQVQAGYQLTMEMMNLPLEQRAAFHAANGGQGPVPDEAEMQQELAQARTVMAQMGVQPPAIPRPDDGREYMKVGNDLLQVGPNGVALAYRAPSQQRSSIPSGIQELEYRARAAGLQPGSPEYQQFMLNDGKVGGDGQGSGLLAEGFGTLPAGAQNAIIKQEEQFLKDIEAELARYENIASQTQQFLTGSEGYNSQGAGIAADIGQALSRRTSDLKAITNTLAPMKRQPGSGNMSDKDVEMFARSTVNINNTPETNRRIAANEAAVRDYQRDYARSAREWQSRNGMGSLGEFQRLWGAYKEEEPIFTEEENDETGLGMPDPNRLSFNEWMEVQSIDAELAALQGGGR